VKQSNVIKQMHVLCMMEIKTYLIQHGTCRILLDSCNSGRFRETDWIYPAPHNGKIHFAYRHVV